MNDATLPVTAYIGLGSNLQQPELQIAKARQAIVNLLGVVELAFSRLVQTPPMGPQDQPHYLNAVMAVNTTLQPLVLFNHLQEIENAQGSVRRTQRWVARTLDLDLLLYGDQMISTPALTLPHVGIADRAFVLYPLHEIAPDLTIPGLGAVAELIAHCPSEGLEWIPSD